MSSRRVFLAGALAVLTERMAAGIVAEEDV